MKGMGLMALSKKARSRALNIVMVVLAAVVVVTGVLGVIGLKGAGSAPDGASAQVSSANKLGNVNIERSGIAYAVEEGDSLTDGDILETLADSEITVRVAGGGDFVLAEKSEAVVRVGEGVVTLDLLEGEVFTDVASTGCQLALGVPQGEFLLSDAAAFANVRVGSSSLDVLSGSASESSSGLTARAGESLCLLGNEDVSSAEVASLDIASLNDFALEKSRALIEGDRTLCFDIAQIDEIVAERAAQKAAASSAPSLEESAGVDGVSGNASGSENAGVSASSELMTCTIEIRCDTILDNMGNLAPGKDVYVPSNGVILSTSTVQFAEGDTVFDVLRAACSSAGIQLEYSYTPGYGAYYVEGVNNLYEFDCGNQSGWMYKVNGWFPNYGCSSYELENGDAIVWCYTCNGLGADVGGSPNR